MQVITALCLFLFISTVFCCCSTVGDTSITCNGSCSYTYINNKCSCLDESPCQPCSSLKSIFIKIIK